MTNKKYKSISISNLIINPDNDRFESVENEKQGQRESGTFFVYKFSSFLEKVPFPVFNNILFYFKCSSL